jgi:aminoglycoside 3-N-acetyltransferase
VTAAPELTVSRIAAQVSALGVRPGGVLLVHSSLSSMGHVEGGAETAIQALLQALGPMGTLLMPALSYDSVHSGQTHFDRHATPCCVGAIAEAFRLRGGTLRSGSPTHSICASGPQAAQIVGDHHLDTTPVGPRSPLRKVRDLGGQLMFLGCGLRPNTSMHGVEELVEPPYLFGAEVCYSLQLGERRHTISCRRHDFAGWVQNYERVAEVLCDIDLRVGMVCAAQVHLLEARPMWDSAAAALRQDAFAFVSREGDN